MSEKIGTFNIPTGIVDWDQEAEYYTNEGEITKDAELVNRKEVKNETAAAAKSKIIAFRGGRALKAVFTPKDDKLAA